MKKVSLLAILATAASIPAAMAQAPVASAANCPKAFQGFHLGGNIGYGIGKGKTTLTRTDAADNVIDSHKFDLGFNGVDGGVGVGYTHRFCNWALGIAFDANWASTSGKFTSEEANGHHLSTKGTLRNSLQLYGRAGYVLANMVMPFVGLGWDNSQWKQTARFDEGGDNVFSGSKSKRFNAFLWKAGVDFLATKHVVVGLEYTGTAAGKKSFSATGDDDTVRSGSFKPQYNKFALTAKLVY